MWFKQAQLFRFEDKISFDVQELKEKLEPLAFTSCLSSLPFSQGWVSPCDEETDSLVYAVPGFLLICLQIEEKLLPASIIRQKLKEEIQKIESNQEKKISHQEKKTLRQKIYNELLPKAFGKLTRNYAFIDIKNNWLILNTNNAKRVKNFISFLTRSLNDTKIVSAEIKKISPILTSWLLNNKSPETLNIEDVCVLQDPRQQQRSVRIQRQELSVNYVQSLLKNNLDVSQVKMTWSDQITFVMKNDFSLQSLQYKDSEIELSGEDKADTQEGSFRANFFIMSGILSKMFSEFLEIFKDTASKVLTTDN